MCSHFFLCLLAGLRGGFKSEVASSLVVYTGCKLGYGQGSWRSEDAFPGSTPADCKLSCLLATLLAPVQKCGSVTLFISYPLVPCSVPVPFALTIFEYELSTVFLQRTCMQKCCRYSYCKQLPVVLQCVCIKRYCSCFDCWLTCYLAVYLYTKCCSYFYGRLSFLLLLWKCKLSTCYCSIAVPRDAAATLTVNCQPIAHSYSVPVPRGASATFKLSAVSLQCTGTRKWCSCFLSCQLLSCSAPFPRGAAAKLSAVNYCKLLTNAWQCTRTKRRQSYADRGYLAVHL